MREVSQLQAQRPHVFLSYSRRDEASGDMIASALDGAGIPYWRDIKEIEAGEDFREPIVSALLSDATCLVVLLSEHSIHSVHVQTEAGLAHQERLPRIPVSAPCSS